MRRWTLGGWPSPGPPHNYNRDPSLVAFTHERHSGDLNGIVERVEQLHGTGQQSLGQEAPRLMRIRHGQHRRLPVGAILAFAALWIARHASLEALAVVFGAARVLARAAPGATLLEPLHLGCKGVLRVAVKDCSLRLQNVLLVVAGIAAFVALATIHAVLTSGEADAVAAPPAVMGGVDSQGVRREERAPRG